MKTNNDYLDQLVRDENRIPVQVASGIVTTNGVQSSPLAYLTASSTALTIPDRAAELIISPSTLLRFSEDSTMATYATIVASTTLCIPVAKMQTIYIKGDSADGTAILYWTIV